MKNPLKLIFVFCITTINLYPQEWVKINPVFDPPGNYNTHVGSFSDKNNGWWVELFPGTIWYTSDGGNKWTIQFDQIEAGYYDIVFADSSHGWLIGQTLPPYQQFILFTKDGGNNWSQNFTPTILSISFIDSLNGFAGGEDTIYSTSDGGITWEPTEVESGVRFGINDIFFSDKMHGWAVGGSSTLWDAGIILKSINGSKYWSVNEHPSDIYGEAVYFTDSLHGYIVGSNPPIFNGIIKVTSDGGNNWITHYLPGSWLNDVVFTDDSTGWAVGDYGYIWHTSDRGITWTKVESGTTSDLHNIYFFDNGTVGYIMGENSVLLKYEKPVSVINNPQPVYSFELFQNYPNPFNPTTNIRFNIKKPGLVRLKIYDSLGKEVNTLVNEEKLTGGYTVQWNGKNKFGKEVSSGIYFYQLQAGSLSKVRKLIFIK